MPKNQMKNMGLERSIRGKNKELGIITSRIKLFNQPI